MMCPAASDSDPRRRPNATANGHPYGGMCAIPMVGLGGLGVLNE
jgi:hypothetical protein